MRKYYQKYKKEGKCTNCLQPSYGKSRCQKCSNATKISVYQKRKLAKQCTKCGSNELKTISLCQSCSSKFGLKQTEKLRRQRQECIKYYGGKCNCCGENYKEFMTFDHIGNDGAKHRLEMKTRNIVPWLIRNNFPNNVQLLCWNCNAAKQYYGKCPHKKDKIKESE